MDITHYRDRDLDIFLVDPSGTRAILLSSDNGQNNNHYPGTVFRTDGIIPIATAPWPFNGEYLPEGAIDDSQVAGEGHSSIPTGNLEGASIDGNWTLYVFDDNTRGELGTLNSWDLSIIKQTGSGFTTVFNGPNDIGTVNYSGTLNETATVTVTPTTAGTHTYTATTTDANGCTATSNTVTITVNETPDAFIAADYCSIDGRIELTALGGAAGATYSWSTGETTQAIVVDEVNIYSVTITNPNGCFNSAQLNVSNEQVVNGDFTNTNLNGPTDFITGYAFHPNVAGNNELVDDSGNNGYSVGESGQDFHSNFWGIDHTNNSVGLRNFMLINGHEDITVWQQTVIIQPNTNYYFSAWAMSINAVGPYARLVFEVNGTLVGDTAVLGPGPNSVSEVNANNYWTRFRSTPNWNSGSVSGPITIRIVNLEEAYNGNDFALDDISFGTLDPLPLEIDIIANDVCEDDTLFLYSNSLNGLEPITYVWTGPNGFTSNEQNPYIPNITLAASGEYKMEATDGYGCEILPDSIVVTVNLAPTVDAGPDQEVCTANPVVYLNGIIGGSAVSATWSGSGGTYDNDTLLDASYTLSASEITAGIATLVLTTDDPAGACEPAFDTMLITIFNSLVITSIDSVPVFCNGFTDGTATANVSLGTPPYEYIWSDGQTTPTAINLAAGKYYLAVSDANGCIAVDSVVITEPEPFVIAATSPQIFAPSCYNASDGWALVEVSGGIPPYTFQWDAAAGSQTQDTAWNLSAGNYFVFVTDSAGCAAATIPVTIPNPPPPTLSCPGNVEDTIHADSCGITYLTLPDPTYSGYCTPTLTYTLSGATTASGTGSANGELFNIGLTTVTYTIADTVGNTTSCSFEVLVKHLDIPPGAFTCPTDSVSVDNDAGTCDATITLDAPNIIDPCNEIDSVWNNSPHQTDYSDASGTYPIGTTNFTWYITDFSGNIDSCEVVVIVNDTMPPTISCPPDATEIAAANNCSKTLAAITDPTIGDNCTNTTLTWEMSGATTGTGSGTVTGETFNVGITTVEYFVEDDSGNRDSCTFNVTIVDITPPNLQIGGCVDVTETAAADSCSKTPVTIINPTYSDDCWPIDSLVLTYVISGATTASDTGSVGGVTFNVGVSTVTYTVTDPDGNNVTCDFEVTIVDITPPNLQIGGCVDVAETAAADSCSIIPTTLTNPTYSDDCWPVNSLVLTYAISGATTGSGTGSVVGVAFNIGISTVTYTVTDPDGNIATCDFEVTIIHLDIPQSSFICPADSVFANTSAGNCDAVVNLGTLTINDPCNEIDSVWNNSPYQTDYSDASGTYPIGITDFTWYITDLSGNIDSCEVTVIVEDADPPQFLTCPDTLQDVINQADCERIGLTFTDPTWSEPCGAILTYILSGVTTGSGTGSASGETFNIGQTLVTYILTDTGNNTDTCEFIVWVKHANFPTSNITCPTDSVWANANPATCDADVTLGTVGINDPCNEIDSVWNNSPHQTSYSDASGTYPIGITDFTWYITDLSGNIDSCEVTVIVEDVDPPQFLTCPADTLEDIIDPVLCEITNFNLIDPTWDIGCGADLRYELSGVTTGSGTGLIDPAVVTFNVGVTTITYILEDPSGNADTCIFWAWAKHVDFPTSNITCPTDSVWANADPAICAAVVPLDPVVYTDPCNEIDSVWNNSPFQTDYSDASGTYPIGITDFVWYITDVSGNIDSCQVTVIVRDVDAPQFTYCPPDTLQDIISPDSCSITTLTLEDPNWTEPCGAILTWVLTGATIGSGTGLISGVTFNVGITDVTYVLLDSGGNTDTCDYVVWVKHLNIPPSGYDCPQPLWIVDADSGRCDAYLTLDRLEIVTDPCNEFDSIWHDSPYGTDPTDASGYYPIGTTTFYWYISDVSGNIESCEVVVTVNDLLPTLICPTDIIEQADFEQAYASGIVVPPPYYYDNCDSTLTWVMSGATVYTDGDTASNGINIVNSPDTFNLGVTTIEYTFTDGNGNVVICDFTITVLGAPDIECPPDTTIYLDGTENNCLATFDPGVPDLIEGVPPITWTYTLTNPDGSTITDTYIKDTPDQYANPFGDYSFELGVTTIEWRAENISGYDTCSHWVEVIDTIPPTFTTAPFEDCVDPLHWATYDPANVNPIINHINPNMNKYPSPDFRTFPAGDTSLDLITLEDNCCDSVDMTIYWRIEFTPTPNPLIPAPDITYPDITGTGQPSVYGSDIELPGDGVYFSDVVHNIFYWVEDCNGNTTEEYREEITITPRPQVIKETY